MRLQGQQDIFRGSIARILWWTGANIAATATATRDIVVYEGWRTVSIDLRSVLLEPDAHSAWRSGNKAGFRLDPHEFPSARSFELDYVKLTGQERASSIFPIRYTVSDADNDVATTISFSYSTSRQGTNGQAIRCATSPPINGGRNKVYLPLIRSAGTPGDDIGGRTCAWNVQSVPNGDYYVTLVVNDGMNRTTITSETPVEIRH